MGRGRRKGEGRDLPFDTNPVIANEALARCIGVGGDGVVVFVYHHVKIVPGRHLNLHHQNKQKPSVISRRAGAESGVASTMYLVIPINPSISHRQHKRHHLRRHLDLPPTLVRPVTTTKKPPRRVFIQRPCARDDIRFHISHGGFLLLLQRFIILVVGIGERVGVVGAGMGATRWEWGFTGFVS